MGAPKKLVRVSVEFTEEEYDMVLERVLELRLPSVNDADKLIHDVVMRSLRRKARKAKKEIEK